MILIALCFWGDQTIQDTCNDVCFKVFERSKQIRKFPMDSIAFIISAGKSADKEPADLAAFSLYNPLYMIAQD